MATHAGQGRLFTLSRHNVPLLLLCCLLLTALSFATFPSSQWLLVCVCLCGGAASLVNVVSVATRERCTLNAAGTLSLLSTLATACGVLFVCVEWYRDRCTTVFTAARPAGEILAGVEVPTPGQRVQASLPGVSLEEACRMAETQQFAVLLLLLLGILLCEVWSLRAIVLLSSSVRALHINTDTKTLRPRALVFNSPVHRRTFSSPSASPLNDEEAVLFSP